MLAANAGGLPDIVTDRRYGLLFPPEDPEALGIVLNEVLGDRVLRENLAAAGRISAARYDPARHAAVMASISTAGRRRGRGGIRVNARS